MGLLVGTAVVAILVGWSGVSAQAADPMPPQQQASLSTSDTTETPSVPLGEANAREVQNQLIALGFDPGPADGQIGPATINAAQQYDLSRGGNGQVSIDGAFLARLKQDDAPRLTYDQVAARSQARHAPRGSTSAPTTNQAGNVVQQIAPILGAIVSNANNRSYGPGYYGPGPGYYGPPPGYYGPHYGYGW